MMLLTPALLCHRDTAQGISCLSLFHYGIKRVASMQRKILLQVLHLLPLLLLASLNTLTFCKIRESSNKFQVNNRRRRDLGKTRIFLLSSPLKLPSRNIILKLSFLIELSVDDRRVSDVLCTLVRHSPVCCYWS